MAFDRTQLEKKLDALLNDHMSKEEAYQWALSQIVTDEYKESAADDPLVYETIQAMIEYNHDDIDYVPTPEDFQYYKRCLRGDQPFEPILSKDKKGSTHITHKPQSGEPTIPQSPQPPRSSFYLVMRVYVGIFGILTIGANSFAILFPDIFSFGRDVTGPGMYFILPIIYGMILLVPFRVLVKGRIFYLNCLILLAGAYYFWETTFQIFMSLRHLSGVLFLLVSIFTGVPATLALILLILRRMHDQS